MRKNHEKIPNSWCYFIWYAEDEDIENIVYNSSILKYFEPIIGFSSHAF